MVYICNFKKEPLSRLFRNLVFSFYKKGPVFTIAGIFNRIYRTTMANFLFLKTQKYFIFREKKIPYSYEKNNNVWASERTIEIPIAGIFLAKHRNSRILEIGNVLGLQDHYDFDVVDKYEKARGVINADIASYSPRNKYPLIISISTLEHVGWDELPRAPEKLLSAIKNINKNCLSAGGEFVFTIPLGYNRYSDYLIKNNKLKMTEQYFYERCSLLNTWKKTTKDAAFKRKYGFPYEFANSLLVGVIKKSNS